MIHQKHFEVVIIGGSYSGLSAEEKRDITFNNQTFKSADGK
jgi:hypothetical protein